MKGEGGSKEGKRRERGREGGGRKGREGRDGGREGDIEGCHHSPKYLMRLPTYEGFINAHAWKIF